MFGIIGSIFLAILMIYFLYAIFTGKVMFNTRTGRNVYVGKTFLIAFILALLAIGSFYLDRRYNNSDGTKAVIEKVFNTSNNE